MTLAITADPSMATSTVPVQRMSAVAKKRAPKCPSDARKSLRLEVLLQIHAGVQLADLRLVPIEHQRLALLGEQAVFTDAALRRLRPARVVHTGIHVGIEPVFIG